MALLDLYYTAVLLDRFQWRFGGKLQVKMIATQSVRHLLYERGGVPHFIHLNDV